MTKVRKFWSKIRKISGNSQLATLTGLEFVREDVIIAVRESIKEEKDREKGNNNKSKDMTNGGLKHYKMLLGLANHCRGQFESEF